MFPDWGPLRCVPRRRAAFALPLALIALVAVALLVAILLDAAVQDLRVGRGDLGGARADAVAETALADFLVAPAAAGFGSSPRGSITQRTVVVHADTADLTVQVLGGDMARVVVAGRAWTNGIRSDAASVAFVRAFPSGAGAPPPLYFRRIPGWWWTPAP